MILLELLLGIVVVIILVPALVLFLEVVMAFRRRPDPLKGAGDRLSVAVLVPAHDEALGIGHTLAAILPQLMPGDRLLVVADNCSDDTAAVAAGAGAEVVERVDSTRRGKGYALDYGLSHLERTGAPDVVVVVDADCHVEPGSIDALARQCAATGRPVQALDLMRDPGFQPWLRIAEFAWILKNWVRPLGLMNSGLPCQLMGTGMAFPWRSLRQAALANGDLAEDLKLGIDLALDGTAPLFCPAACIVSTFPETRRVATVQRTRWEHGHLHLIGRELPRLLKSAVASRNGQLFGMALDMSVPPLALLALLITGGIAASGSAALGGLVRWPLIIALLSAVLFAAAIALSWSGWAKERVPLSALAAVPLYILGKLPLYAAFLTRRQKEWVRTERSNRADG